ncbi:hypothetical protein WJX77_006565 [Trebouxia sp. C0004]
MAILATQHQTRQQWYLQVKPVGVSEDGKNRALVMCNMRQNKLTKTERQALRGPPPETLWELAAKHDKGVGRRWKSQKVLHNREFVIALILDGEGYSDAVPPSWREPRTDLGNGRETLWDLAAKHHKGVGRRWKSQNVLHNREFVISLILDGEEHSDAVMTVQCSGAEPVNRLRAAK